MVVPSEGKSDGLALLWKPEVKVDTQTFSRWHIDSIIDFGDSIGKWQLTRLYGHLDTQGRPESWAHLHQLAKTNNLPWICVGDFNKVLSVTEKQGGLDTPFRQIENFRQCINTCGLKDIGYVGSWFMWRMFSI